MEQMLLEPTENDRQADGVDTAPKTARNDPKTAEIPVVKGPKGLCYDVDKFADEGRRKRILANRKSAKCSRQRRLDEARLFHADLARLEDENNALREANVALRRRITEAQAAIAHFGSRITEAQAAIVHFRSFAANSNTACAGRFSVLPPPVPVTLASLYSVELLDILLQCASDDGIDRHFLPH
jgi:hypothetical protein